MDFIKKYWLWILILAAVAYGGYMWYKKMEAEKQSDKKADKPLILMPEADIADAVQYDGSGINAGVV